MTVRATDPIPRLALLALAPFLASCRQFEDHRARLEGLHAAGQYAEAAAVLDEPKTRELYGAKNEVLWKLDRGAVALAMKDDAAAVSLLNEAEDQIEVQREKSAADVLGEWVINDTAARYTAEPYEDMYLNVVKLLAQLESGRVEGGATVEARRAAGKADRLRDQYLKYEDAAAKQGVPAGGGLVAVNKAGDFIESPLATYLTAVTFLKSGDAELSRVAARRLRSSIELQGALIGPVRADDFHDLAALHPGDFNVLIVALSGRGPTKYAQTVGPIPLGTVPVYFELPYLRTYPSEVAAARVEVDGEAEPLPRPDGGGVGQAPTEGAGTSLQLKLVEDLSAVAVENHNRTLPLIYTRTLIRYAIKAGASVTLTELGRKQASNSNQGWVQLAGVLGGLVALAATEKADLRAWIFLPGQARVGLLNLAAGEHRVRVVYESSAGGAVYASPWQTITVSPGGLASIVTHYWR